MLYSINQSFSVFIKHQASKPFLFAFSFNFWYKGKDNSQKFQVPL